MIPTAPLWPPATTPITEGISRRYLRPRPFTLALALLATLSALLFLATGAAAQLAVSGAVWAAIVIDAVIARRALRDLHISLSSEPLLTTGDPMRCTVRVTGVRRAVTLTPSVRPTVQRFLVEHYRDAEPRVLDHPLLDGIGELGLLSRRAEARAGRCARNLARPAVKAEVLRQADQILRDELLPLALETHKRLLSDNLTPAGAALGAVKLAYDRTLGVDEGKADKEPSEMSYDELQASIETLRREQDARASQAKDVTPESSVFD